MALFGKKKAEKESCPPKKGGGPTEPQPVLKQERSTQDTFQHVFFLQLLFRKMPMSPSVEALQAAAEAKFGPVDIITGQDGQGLCSFAVKKYICHFKDASLPAQVNFTVCWNAAPKKNYRPCSAHSFGMCPTGSAVRQLPIYPGNFRFHVRRPARPGPVQPADGLAGGPH